MEEVVTENSKVVHPVVQPNFFGIGEELGKALSDAVTKATNIVLENSNKPVQVVIGSNDVREVKGYSHSMTPKVLRILSARLPLFLVGEAGSGKTHLVEQCAEALGLKFYCISVCAQTTASTLLGYMDANGRYVRSLFREAYENGGVFLLDEVDNGNPNVLSVLNASISNHVCSFPDKMVPKHKDFVLCASGNTYGHGANRKYVGRLEIDGATLDRFVFVDIGYDEKLENNICGNKAYAKLIQSIRKRAQQLKLRNIISPRASINGVKLLSTGIDIKEVLKYTVFRDMPEDVVKQLTEGNKNYEKALKDFKAKSSEDKKTGKRKREKSGLEKMAESEKDADFYEMMEKAVEAAANGEEMSKAMKEFDEYYEKNREKPDMETPSSAHPVGGIEEKAL